MTGTRPSEDGRQSVARYVYGIVPADETDRNDLGDIGLDGSRVRVVTQGRVSALVHDCAAQPYDGGGESVAAARVLAQHEVLLLAMRRWGVVLPMTFNTIVAPSDGRSADDSLLHWLADENVSLRARVDALVGKVEFGLQVFYVPAAFLRRIAEESAEVRRLEEEAKTKSAGLAYFTRQEINKVLRKELDEGIRDLVTTVYTGARACSDRVTIEKVKRGTDELMMAVNLSCLVALVRADDLQAFAVEMSGRDGLTVRLVGPLPPYSFC